MVLTGSQLRGRATILRRPTDVADTITYGQAARIGVLYTSSPASCGAAQPTRRLVDQMRERKSSVTDLHAQVSSALRLGRIADALALYEQMEKTKPNEPRWSHRKGDLLHKMGKDHDAVAAYQRAVDLYAAKGFEARAAATARLMRQLEPHQLA